MPTLLGALRDHLISENIVRSPRVAGATPPMWLEPRDGAPAPGEGENSTEVGATATVAAFRNGGIAARPYESMLQTLGVDLWLRVKTAPVADTLHGQIRAALIDKRNWTMGGVTVVESSEWATLQPLGSDHQGFTYVCKFMFEIRTADLLA